MTLRIAAALAAGLLLAPLSASAQDYPARPITLVVPYSAGAATDTVARLLGRHLERRMKATVVIENRPGGGSVPGAVYVAHAAADGYTLLHATSTTMAINQHIYKNLPYNPERDLTPVAIIAGVPFVLVVDPKLPVHSIADLVALAKTKPGGLNYASNGHGSAANLYAELLKSMTGMAATHIPYKGGAPALNDVMAGHVSWMFGDISAAMPLVRDDKLRALGVSTAQRVGSAPEIAPLAEAGVPGYDASAWHMVVAPAGTPKPVIARLHTELRAILGDPEVASELSRRGFIPLLSPPRAELENFLRTESVRWGDVVKKAGATGIE